MNRLVIAACAACLATSLSAHQEMTVKGRPSLDNWVETTSRTLDAVIEKERLSGIETGVTYVRFNRGDDGKPRDIATVPSAGFKPHLDRVGRLVVSRINSLDPLFEGAQPNQQFEAAIIVAGNEKQLQSLRAKVDERARRQNAQWAARGVPNPVVALTASAL